MSKYAGKGVYDAWCHDDECSSMVGCLLCPWDAKGEGGTERLADDDVE